MVQDLISIVIPVYNSEKYLKATINTIKNQTISNWEIIFVNDCSTDNSVSIIEEVVCDNITLINLEKNSGPAIARNEGVKRAKGRYLCFQDADDEWDKEKLEKQLKFMKEKNCAFSFTGYQFMDESGNRNGKTVNIPLKLSYKQALKNTTISTITVMFDMEKLSKEDIEMPNIKNEDSATWWKILRKGYTAYGINEILSFYRRSTNTRSSNKFKSVMNTFKIYRNQEKFNIFKSLYYLTCYMYNALKRRI